MGNRFMSEYVYILDRENTPHFVQYRYSANLGDSYRSDIYLKDKSYCVLDLYLTDEVEEEGEYLPAVKEKEWRELLTEGPSLNASFILEEAGLADVPVSKVVFVCMESSSRLLLELDGFVSSAEGVRDFDSAFLDKALSCAKVGTASPANREIAIAEWIVEQIRNGAF